MGTALWRCCTSVASTRWGAASNAARPSSLIGTTNAAAHVRRPLRVHPRRVVSCRGPEVDGGIERLVVDLDELGCVLREVAVARDHQRDGVAHEAHVVACERDERRAGGRAVEQHRGQHRHRDVVVEVVAGEHRDHPLGRACGVDVDAGDAGPGVVAAQEVRVQRAGHDDVVGVAAVAGEQPGIFLADDRLADEPAGGAELAHVIVLRIVRTADRVRRPRRSAGVFSGLISGARCAPSPT